MISTIGRVRNMHHNIIVKDNNNVTWNKYISRPCMLELKQD